MLIQYRACSLVNSLIIIDDYGWVHKEGQERNTDNPATLAVTEFYLQSLKARHRPRTNVARLPLFERFNADLVEVRPPAAHALQRRDLRAPVKLRLPGEDGVKCAERQVTHFRRRHAAPRRRRPGTAAHHGLKVFREEGRERRGHRVEPQRRDVEALVQVLPRRPRRVVGRVLKWSDRIQSQALFLLIRVGCKNILWKEVNFESYCSGS